MKLSKLLLLIVITILTLKYAVAYTPPSSMVSARQDGLEINASLNYNVFTGITELYNFSVTNYNTSSIKWDIPFFIHIEGVEFFEWKARGTNELNSTITGTTIIEHNHNGTLENHTQDVYLHEEIMVEQWKPSKQFLNTAHPKYGKKVNATSTINIGAQSTKYFWARFKTIFGVPKKFDIDFLDPFISAQLYRGGDGAGDFTSDVNKTLSEPVNVTATIMTIGVDAGVSSLERSVFDTFENATTTQWNAGEGGSGGGCRLNTTNTIINGTNQLFYVDEDVADQTCTRRPQDYSRNGEGFNVSFNFKRTNSDNNLFFGFKANNNATSGVVGNAVNQNSVDTFSAFGTGLACNEKNTCQIILEYNATKGSGGANETTMWLWVNGTRSSNRSLTMSISSMDYFLIQSSGALDTAVFDDFEFINSSSATSDVNVTTAGYVRSNKFTHSRTIRRFSYNSSETGTADGLVFNFTCNDYGGTWSQGGGDNKTRQGENTFIDCPALGLIFAYDVNLSQQQDSMQLNISTIDNIIPSSNNTLWNQTVGFGVYTRVNVLNATVNVNEPDGDAYNVTFNWSRSNVNLRFVNVSGSGGAAAQFSDNLNIQTLLKGDTVRIDTFVQDSRSLDGHSGMKTNTTIIADFPVELTRGPSFNLTSNINADNNVLVNLTFREEDAGDNVSVQTTWSRANSHNNVSNNLFSFINTTTNVTSQVNLTLLEGNFSGGDNVSFQIVLNSSASTLGNFTANFSNWFIINTRVGTPNFTNVNAPLKIESSPFEFNWTGAVDALSSETNITYRLEYANDGGDDWVTVNTSHPETNLTWSFRGLSIKYNATYRFRVRSEFGVNFTEYNLTSNITLGENRTDINASTVTILGNDQIGGRYGFDSNITIQVNITPGLLTNITSVTFAVFYPNGSVANITENRSLADADTFLWNSTQRIRLNAGGTYRWKINATNDQGNTTTFESITTANGSFAVDSEYFVNPAQSLLKVIDPAERLLFNVTIYHQSPENITFNSSVFMQNSTAFNVSFSYNELPINGSVHNQTSPALWVLQVNATAATALRDGEYDGNFTITRLSDGNRTVIPIIFGVNPPRGEVTMEANAQGGNQCNSVAQNCLYSKSLTTDAPDSFTWLINNTGAFNLTGCSAHFYDASTGQNLTLNGLNSLLNITGVDETNPLNTSIRPNQTAVLRLDLGSAKTAGSYTANIDVLCRATRFGFVDAASANPNELPYITITVTSPTGTSPPSPSGGPPLPSVVNQTNVTVAFVGCGDNICTTEREDIFSCRIDCAPDFDTLLTSVLSGDLFAQSRVTRVIAIALVVSLLAVYFRGQTPKLRKQPKTAFG